MFLPGLCSLFCTARSFFAKTSATLSTSFSDLEICTWKHYHEKHIFNFRKTRFMRKCFETNMCSKIRSWKFVCNLDFLKPNMDTHYPNSLWNGGKFLQNYGHQCSLISDDEMMRSKRGIRNRNWKKNCRPVI